MRKSDSLVRVAICSGVERKSGSCGFSSENAKTVVKRKVKKKNKHFMICNDL
jgi:hypothetical protein